MFSWKRTGLVEVGRKERARVPKAGVQEPGVARGQTARGQVARERVLCSEGLCHWQMGLKKLHIDWQVKVAPALGGNAWITKGVNGLLPLDIVGHFLAFQALAWKHTFKDFLSQRVERIHRISRTALFPSRVSMVFPAMSEHRAVLSDQVQDCWVSGWDMSPSSCLPWFVFYPT